MAKKTRIDRRGKIRSIVRRFPPVKKAHWTIVKRAANWKRRRHIDEVIETDVITITETITPHLNRFINDSLSTSDAVKYRQRSLND